MTTPGGFGLRQLWAEAWEPPDPQTRDYGREGEILFARVRLAIIAIIVIIPLKSVLLYARSTDNWIGLGVAGAALVIGVTVLALARRPAPPRWLGLSSSLLDVSLVSAGNVGFLLAGHPLTATNSQVVFSIYFLALTGTCLRHDARVCVAAGVAALLEYGAVVVWSTTRWNLAGAAFANDPYGAFSWDSQVGRLLLLALATALISIIVSRAGRHWRDSIYDRLTGLPNRRYIEQRLDEALAAARRTRRPLVLALADIDHFKQINDRHGHAAGDLVLRHAAGALRQAFRRNDVIARYGGEEFVILFPEAEPAAAAERLESFRAAFAERPVQLDALPPPQGGALRGQLAPWRDRHHPEARMPAVHRGPPAHPGEPGAHAVPVTLSVGLSVFPGDGEEPSDLLARADQRLYAAKQAGRNRLQRP